MSCSIIEKLDNLSQSLPKLSCNGLTGEVTMDYMVIKQCNDTGIAATVTSTLVLNRTESEALYNWLNQLYGKS